MPQLPTQTRRAGRLFLAWLLASLALLVGYDRWAYLNATPGDTISAWFWAAFDAPWKRALLALVLAAIAALLIAHLCLGLWRGEDPS